MNLIKPHMVTTANERLWLWKWGNFTPPPGYLYA